MDSRQRLIETTLRLLRSQGLRATGINEIIRQSGAPRGSIYHHFPGGKEQLVIEALRAAGALIGAKIGAAMAGQASAAAALRAFARVHAEEMMQSDYLLGCPVGNAAADASASSPAVRQACAEIFSAWEQLIAEGFQRAGLDRLPAAALAEFVVASVEGALILCRVRRSMQPLERVGQQLEWLLSSVTPG
ncbi:MAG: TetR/AcrR family transcriptional regulator [Alphaproteobacteria bacterium]|nr:TetR/AcrR family transcriptional regulator [Alphaproteobacteria bacterium]